MQKKTDIYNNSITGENLPEPKENSMHATLSQRSTKNHDRKFLFWIFVGLFLFTSLGLDENIESLFVETTTKFTIQRSITWNIKDTLHPVFFHLPAFPHLITCHKQQTALLHIPNDHHSFHHRNGFPSLFVTWQMGDNKISFQHFCCSRYVYAAAARLPNKV